MGRKRSRIDVARVYDAPSLFAGHYRVLVDRLWPRGIKRESLQLDEWLKEIAPGPTLRKWFAHDPSRWETFCERYFEELREKPELTGHLLEVMQKQPLLLLFAARDMEYNNAVALREFLRTEC